MTKGNKIKLLRQAANITQEQLANTIGTTKQTIFKYENDLITNIPIDKLVVISGVLHVSPAYLMGWDENKKLTVVSDGELEKKLLSDPRKYKLAMTILSLDSAGLDRFEKILDIVELEPK